MVDLEPFSFDGVKEDKKSFFFCMLFVLVGEEEEGECLFCSGFKKPRTTVLPLFSLFDVVSFIFRVYEEEGMLLFVFVVGEEKVLLLPLSSLLLFVVGE